MPVLYVNPNDALSNDGQLNQDDLSIAVQLTTVPKSRSVIVSDGTSSFIQPTVQGGQIFFIDGTQYGNEKVLTTDYTSYKSDNKNLIYDFNNTIEGLGITNIDVSFNTSYVPIVKINFVDVRGGVLSRGNTSKYRVFFDLPYPIFKLTMKGYYGKGVTYCLHMTKWNALFNSGSGNFEITAEFIGYTYAMLTDTLMGTIRAVPYTTIGRSAFESNKNGQPNQINIVTIDDMLRQIDIFNQSLDEFKQTSEYSKIIEINKNYTAITDIKTALNKLINVSKTLNTQVISDGDTYVCLGGQNKFSDNDIKEFKNSVSTALNTLKKYNNKNLDSYYIQSNNVDGTKFNKVGSNQTDQAKKELIDKSNETYNSDVDSKRLYDFVITLHKRGIDKYPTSFNIYDFYKLCELVNDIITQIETEEEATKRALSQKLRENFAASVGFEPTIENIYAVIIAHIEAFFKTVCIVSNNAERNTYRSEVLNRLIDGSSSYYDVDGSNIYPWPTYMKNKGDTITESWLGEDVNVNDVDELAFIEELMAVMLDQTKKDIELNNYLTALNKWNPISPLDTPIMGVKRNPYLVSYGKNNTVIYPESVIRFLMFRIFYYYYVNKNVISDIAKDYIPKLEAMNAFYSINDDKLKDAIVSRFSDKQSILDFFKSPTIPGKEDKDNPYITENNGSYIYSYISGSTKNESQQYQYIPVFTDSINKESFDRSNFMDGNIVKSSLPDGVTYITNRFSTDSTAKYFDIIPSEIFDSADFNNIITYDEDLDKSYSDKYKDKFIDEAYVVNSYTLSANTGKLPSYRSPITDNVMNIPTFRRNDSSNGKSVASLFYVNTKNGTGLSEYKNVMGTTELNNIDLANKLYYNDNTSVFPNDISYTFINNENIIDGLNTVSLFGSPLYYAQNATQDLDRRDKAKAFLFINTLPFRGMFGKPIASDSGDYFVDSSIFGSNRLEQGDSEFNTRYISSLLSSNAGFVEIPDSWLIWVGSLLWRSQQETDPIVFSGVYNGQSVSVIPGFANNQLPDKNHLIHSLTIDTMTDINEVDKSPMFMSNNVGVVSADLAIYKPVDKILLTLPDEAKNKLINKFETWALDSSNISGFRYIKNRLEVNYLSSLVQGAQSPDFTQWQTYAQLQLETSSTPSVYPEFNNINYSSVTVNYRGKKTLTGSITTDALSNPTSLKDFSLTITYSDEVINSLLTLFSKTSVLVNINPYIWSRYSNSPNDITKKIASSDFRSEISVPTASFETFVDNFINQFKKLYDAEKNSKVSDDELKADVFQTKENNDIKLQLYRHVSSVNNKWIAGNQNGFYPCSSRSEENCDFNIFETFRFLDKAFRDIGDVFPINADSLSELLRSNWNQSFYDFTSRLLSDNNFNFIALPSYVEFNDPNKLKDSVFKPYTYNNSEWSTDMGPRFICMYAGQPSTSLNIGGNNFPDDGVIFDIDGAKTSNGNSANGWNTDESNVCVFEVNYGQGNQNIFKDIRLDQSEFTETLESLVINENLSSKGAYDKNATKIGQNLFNVYQTRSYSAEVDAMGMAMIQPMMYFQLNDIPIFRGGYLITSVTHNIKPNHMTTKFKGTRVRAAFTPIIEDFYAIRALDLGSSEKPTKISIVKNNIKTNSADEVRPNGGGSPIINKNDSTRLNDGFNIYDYNFKHSIKSYGFTLDMLDMNSNATKNGVPMTYNDIFKEISDKTGIPSIVLKTTSVVESLVGNNKTVKAGKPNNFGYVGLMQFGRPAASDVENQLNEYIKNSITSSEYSFYNMLFDFSGQKKLKLIPGGDWTNNTATNNPNTNIFFDDYISTLAMALYAIKYINTNPSEITNIVDVYLTHQQGPSGIRTIKNNPTNLLQDGSSTSRNMLNNRPLPTDDTSKYPTYIDWYLGWAGRIDAVAKAIDPTYKSSIAGTEGNTPNADRLRVVLKELNYKEKNREISSSGDINTKITDATIAILKKIKQKLPDITIEITAGNDKSHESSQSSNHSAGNSIDFVVYKSNGDKITPISGWKQSPSYSSYDDGILGQIENVLLGYVYGNLPKFRMLNEYRRPTQNATGPHFHITWREDGGSTEGEYYVDLAKSKYNSGEIEAYYA